MTINSDDKIVISNLNGSIGCLDLPNKMYKNLIRSHTGRILDAAYNRKKMCLATIGFDHTIRLWDCNKKMVQSYEFQVLDLMPTTLASFHYNDYIVVGFDSGLLRLFDIHENRLLLEKQENEGPIQQLIITYDDKFVISGDIHGNLIVFNNTLEFVKKILIGEADTLLKLGVDYYSTYLVAVRDPYTLILFDLELLDIKYKIFLDEEVVSVKFSYFRNYLIILTNKGKIKFYALGEDRAEMIKEHGYLHDGMI